MNKRKHNSKFNDIQVYIIRVAETIFLILLLVKLFIAEISNW